MKRSLEDHNSWQSGHEIRETGTIESNGQWVYLKKEIAHVLIYPHWDPLTFSNGKTRSNIFSDKDMWLLKDRNSGTTQMLLAAIRRLQKSPNWVSPTSGVKSLWSRIYPLEKINNLQDWDLHYPY
jgi:hypothetical protein